MLQALDVWAMGVTLYCFVFGMVSVGSTPTLAVGRLMFDCCLTSAWLVFEFCLCVCVSFFFWAAVRLLC